MFIGPIWISSILQEAVYTQMPIRIYIPPPPTPISSSIYVPSLHKPSFLFLALVALGHPNITTVDYGVCLT